MSERGLLRGGEGVRRGLPAGSTEHAYGPVSPPGAGRSTVPGR